MPDLNETIEQVASEPAAASADGQSVTNQDLSKLIEAKKHLAEQEAMANNASGWGGAVRPARVAPPGASS